jgi:ATP-dependent RNA helicase RhlE
MSFDTMGLREDLLHAIQRLRYVDSSPIQAEAIPVVLSGRDLIASAQTGTGKTAAFALPILQQLERPGKLRCLVLEPTRELAAQVADNFEDYTAFSPLRTTLIHGGVKYGRQQEQIAAGTDVLVATPGRLLDFMEMGVVRLNDIRHLVLDEADRMLDMGFLPDVRRIIEKCPVDRQTMLFSATMPPPLEGLISWALRDPHKISIGRTRSPAETVTHVLYPVASDQKFDLLLAILDHLHYESVIVFTRTKADADAIYGALEQANHKVGVIHGDRNQSDRTHALEQFKNGGFEVLVATNIAARGLDIAGVSHVINYDVPEDPDDYVHRIGRTGRAQKTGDALTILTAFDLQQLRAIEYQLGITIPRLKLDHFPYKYTALLDESAAEAAPAPKPRRSLRQG